MKQWDWICRIAWILLFVLGLLAASFVFLPKCRDYQRLQRTKLALENENNQLESNIRLLETNRKRFTYDKDFVERTAREQGMAKPGETIFKFESKAQP